MQVLETWGRRCTYLRFLTTEEDEDIPTFVSDSKEEYMQIWGKTKEGWSYYCIFSLQLSLPSQLLHLQEGFRRTFVDYYDKVNWYIFWINFTMQSIILGWLDSEGRWWYLRYCRKFKISSQENINMHYV